MKNKTTRFFSNVGLLFSIFLIAQNTHAQKMDKGCLPKYLPALEQQALEVQMKNVKSNAKLGNTGLTCIPIKIHDVRDNLGSGSVDMTKLNKDIANLNYYFFDVGIEFYICGAIDVLNSSTYYDFDDTEEDDLIAAMPMATNAFNLYLVDNIASAAGYAYLPYNGLKATFCIIDKNVLAGYANGTTVHEYGHHFNLYHTHNDTENGNTDPGAENVPRTGTNANCTTHGDFLCDTEADPKGTISNCAYTGGGVDIHGNAYDPPIDNIMSYYSDACGGIFTPQQISRMATALTVRQGHSAYSLNCAATSVAAPSSLSAAISGNAVALTWTDNANNELGYIIERSTTSSSSGFRALKMGGTASDATTFSDATVANTTTYWYRIKASNGNCNTYSNVAQITTGLNYCVPSISLSCTNSVISNVTIVGESSTINNNSTCADDITDYSTIYSTDVVVGKKYYMSVTQSNNAYNRYAQLFIDWNKDGDFLDSDEKMFPDDSDMNPDYGDSILIPANAINGTTRARFIITSHGDGTILSACDNQSYGEAEDYTLDISGGVSSVLLDRNYSSEKLSFIPNPSEGIGYLSCYTKISGEAQLNIRTLDGNSLQKSTIQLTAGENSISMNLAAAPAGIYFIEVIQGDKILYTKMIKY